MIDYRARRVLTTVMKENGKALEDWGMKERVDD